MDFIRMVIEGGWVVRDNEEWIQVLRFLEISQEVGKSLQAMEFFRHAAKVYGFDDEFKDYVNDYEIK